MLLLKRGYHITRENSLEKKTPPSSMLHELDIPNPQLSFQLENKSSATTIQPVQNEPNTRPADFIKIEKNLASLGFFTPSHKRISGVKQKVVALSREVNGKRLEARATILPSAQYGLPTTADQDTYLAILKLASDLHKKRGKVTNPIGFTSAQLLRIQGKSCVSGYHYKELYEQLLRIKTSTILSEGAVYFAGRKVWAKDAFNVISRLVLLGARMEDGIIADKHYVWFSDWQLENINNNYLLPIDYDTYKQLKNHTAKILVPLLQIWLYASRNAGCFEKRYEEICQFLNIRVYSHLSKIKEKLGPSLDELKTHGYLSNWQVQRTSDGVGYKVILFHGEKFRRDLERRSLHRPEPRFELKEKQRCTTGPIDDRVQAVDERLLTAMVERGISTEMARDVLMNAPAGQEIMDQLEWGDYQIAQASAGKFRNPPGFYIYLVRENLAPPSTFETSRTRKLREQADAARFRALQDKAGLELAYMDYRKQEIDRHIAAQFSNEAYIRALEEKRAQLRGSYKNAAWLTEQQQMEFAAAHFRKDVAKGIQFISFESFCQMKTSGNWQ